MRAAVSIWLLPELSEGVLLREALPTIPIDHLDLVPYIMKYRRATGRLGSLKLGGAYAEWRCVGPTDSSHLHAKIVNLGEDLVENVFADTPGELHHEDKSLPKSWLAAYLDLAADMTKSRLEAKESHQPGTCSTRCKARFASYKTLLGGGWKPPNGWSLSVERLRNAAVPNAHDWFAGREPNVWGAIKGNLTIERSDESRLLQAIRSRAGNSLIVLTAERRAELSGSGRTTLLRRAGHILQNEGPKCYYAGGSANLDEFGTPPDDYVFFIEGASKTTLHELKEYLTTAHYESKRPRFVVTTKFPEDASILEKFNPEKLHAKWMPADLARIAEKKQEVEAA